MTEIQKRERNVNLDLLRIFSMFLHSIDHSGVLQASEDNSMWMQAYVRITYAFTQVCVNCYVLLSGYFLVKSKFRLQKLVALWMEVVFYSFTIKVIFMLLGVIPFSIASLISCFFPILTGRYWFITIYIGLYLIAPFLNKAIYAMDEKQHTMLNILLFMLLSIWVSIHPSIAGMNSGRGWGLPWFIVLYFVAAWFRLYYKCGKLRKKKIVMMISVCVVISAIMAVSYVGASMLKSSALKEIVSNWYKYDSAPVYIMTICLFILFLEIRINNQIVQKCVIKCAPATLGVYLIHAHAEVSPWLWETLALPEKMQSWVFILIQFACVSGILVILTIIDILRNNTVGRLEKSNQVYVLSEKILEKVQKYLKRIEE